MLQAHTEKLITGRVFDMSGIDQGYINRHYNIEPPHVNVQWVHYFLKE